jgi:hypothetical protein
MNLNLRLNHCNVVVNDVNDNLTFVGCAIVDGVVLCQ